MNIYKFESFNILEIPNYPEDLSDKNFTMVLLWLEPFSFKEKCYRSDIVDEKFFMSILPKLEFLKINTYMDDKKFKFSDKKEKIDSLITEKIKKMSSFFVVEKFISILEENGINPRFSRGRYGYDIFAEIPVSVMNKFIYFLNKTK